MLSAPLVIGVSFAYLLLLFAVAHWADRRAAQGRSVIASPWVYALSLAVYCTAGQLGSYVLDSFVKGRRTRKTVGR